jgi:hypothetical protein
MGWTHSSDEETTNASYILVEKTGVDVHLVDCEGDIWIALRRILE